MSPRQSSWRCPCPRCRIVLPAARQKHISLGIEEATGRDLITRAIDVCFVDGGARSHFTAQPTCILSPGRLGRTLPRHREHSIALAPTEGSGRRWITLFEEV